MDEHLRALMADADRAEAEAQRVIHDNERRMAHRAAVVRRRHSVFRDTTAWDFPELTAYTPPAPASQKTTIMNVDSKSWNAWARSICEDYAEVLNKNITEEINKLVDDTRTAILKRDAEIASLRERVLKLEVTNDILRSFMTSGSAKMLTIKGGRDVA